MMVRDPIPPWVTYRVGVGERRGQEMGGAGGGGGGGRER